MDLQLWYLPMHKTNEASVPILRPFSEEHQNSNLSLSNVMSNDLISKYILLTPHMYKRSSSDSTALFLATDLHDNINVIIIRPAGRRKTTRFSGYQTLIDNVQGKFKL